MMYLTWKSLCVSVSSQMCFCELSRAEQIVCHLAGYELVTCLGCSTGVPYYEKSSAGFNSCAFAMHDIQVCWKRTLQCEFRFI